MSALTPSPVDSGNCSAMFAAIVEGLLLEIRLNVIPPDAGQHDGDGQGLAERAAEAEHGAADDAGLAVGQHRHPDHLPAGRAEGERGLPVQGRRLAEHLAGDRAR